MRNNRNRRKGDVGSSMVESGMYQCLHNMLTILIGVQKNRRARPEGTMIQCEMERCETLIIVSS